MQVDISKILVRNNLHPFNSGQSLRQFLYALEQIVGYPVNENKLIGTLNDEPADRRSCLA